MALRPYPEAIAAAGLILRQARTTRDSLPPREAALLALRPDGPPLEEVEALIIRHRAEAIAARERAAA